MRMKLYTLLCISFFLLFTACNQDDDPVPPEKVSRTVLVYIMADNSLSNYASLDIDEMMVGMAAVDASDNNLLVYVDDNSREGSPSYNPPTLFRLSKDKSGTVLKEVVREYKEQVSTDASVMEEVMKRTFAEYPAESYGLVVWSHGEGWIPSPLPIVKKTSTRWIGEDSGHHLNIADMAFIFEKVGCHLDFILFDACFGQSVEVAYELHDYVDYIIGSPTEIPGPGASYDKVVPAMFAAANVGIEIGKAYYDPYAALYTGDRPSRFEDPWTAGVSVSVIDCAALENLASPSLLYSRFLPAVPRGLSALSGRYSVFRLFFYCLADDWRYLRIQTVAAAAFCVHMPACQRISDTDLEPPGLYVLFPVMPVPYPCIQQACGNDSNYNDSLQFFHGR